MRIQKPLRNKMPRKKLGTSAIMEIRHAVAHAAREYKCSKSFIISVALAKFFGIKNQEKFY